MGECSWYNNEWKLEYKQYSNFEKKKWEHAHMCAHIPGSMHWKNVTLNFSISWWWPMGGFKMYPYHFSIP